MQKDDIFNRALVLVSMRYQGKKEVETDGDDSGLFCFTISNETDATEYQENATDEEDAFLTYVGISFARKSLL